MRLLSLDTSTDFGSCALLVDGAIDERICPAGQAHSETLLPLVRELLDVAGLRVADLDAIAFGVGPGAFTGLRVACGAAQGLAVAAGLPLIPIGSLETMASATGASHVISLLDARMSEVYVGRYVLGETGYAQVGEISVLPPDRIDLPEGNRWVACGNAPRAYPALAARLLTIGMSCHDDIVPRARDLIPLAVDRYAKGAVIDPALAAPLYVRDKVAKTVAERLGEGGKA